MDDDEDFLDDAFLAAVDQLVAQHQGKGQQLTQPDSPGARPSARAASAGPPTAQLQQVQRPVPPAQHHGLHQQVQQHLPLQQPAFPVRQHQPTQQPPPQLNGALGPGSALTRPSSAPPQPEATGGPGSGPSGQTGFPIGRVTQLAAELRAQGGPAGSAAPADLEALLNQLQQERGRLQEQLGSAEGTNKLLRSNLDQAERERQSLRQRLQQLEARSQPSTSTQASFTALEMQRQLETLKQQLLFKEQEMEELKRQQSDKLERLREAEAAVQSLQTQVMARQQQQQQQHGGGGSPSAAAGQRSSASLRRPLAEQQQQQPAAAGTQQPQRLSGQKRRQSAAGEASAGAPQASLPANVPGTNQAAAGSTAKGRAAPLLGPVVVTAAGLGAVAAGAGLVSRLWAVCGNSLGALLGAPASDRIEAPVADRRPAGSSLGAAGGALGSSEPAPTALLLRTQAISRAAAVPDPLAGSFQQAFGQQLQQVAAGLLPASSLVDSIAALAASVIGLACKAGGKQALSPGAPATPGAKPGAQASSQLPQTQLQLLSDGLQVLQHLLEQDASCLRAAVVSASGRPNSQPLQQQPAAAAAPPSIASPAIGDAAAELGRWLQLSQRVSLSVSGGKEQGKLQQQPSALLPVLAPDADPGQALSQLDRALRQHSHIFAAWGEGLLSVLVGASVLAGQQHLRLLQAALGTLRALAAGMPAGSGREALWPVLSSGALESFMRPPALRQPALQLLHLLLECPALTQAFEQSLASAGSSGAGGGETPGAGATTATATAGVGLPSDPSGGASGQPSKDPTEGNSKGKQQPEAEPMQVDMEHAPTQASGTTWSGAPYVLRRALQTLSLALPGRPPPAQSHQQQQGPVQPPAATQQQAVPAHEQQPGPAARAAGGWAATAAAMPAMAEAPGTVTDTCGWYGAQRQALGLVAMLRERHSYGILSHLIHGQEEGGASGGGAGLCHRLVQLLRAASAQRDPGCAPSPLLPAQFPTGPLELARLAGSNTAGGPLGGAAAAACAAQLERLRLAQEALTLLRGLLLDETVGGHVLEELVSPPASCRLWLATLSRLSRLEPPPQHPHSVAAVALPLAPWAQAIGSSSSVAGGCINPGAGRGPLCCCSVEDVAYMARSMRHRLLHRLGAQQQQ